MLDSIGLQQLQENNKRKKTLFHSVLSEAFSYLSEKLPLSQNYVTSEGSVSRNVIYHLHFPINLYANTLLRVITNSAQCL